MGSRRCTLGNHSLCAACREPVYASSRHSHTFGLRATGEFETVCAKCNDIVAISSLAVVRAVKGAGYTPSFETILSLLQAGNIMVVVARNLFEQDRAN